MKKLFLLLSAGLLVLSANAQQNNSVVFKHAAMPAKHEGRAITNHVYPPFMHPHSATANKTTNVTYQGYFNYFQQLFSDPNYGGIGTEFLYDTYPDSTLVDAAEYGGNIFFHGFGVSFDPTDSAFSYAYYNSDPAPIFVPLSFAVKESNAYQIDTVVIAGQYVRHANYTDSLILDLGYEPATPNNTINPDSTTFLQLNPGSTIASITSDGTPRIVVPPYDSANNQIAGAGAGGHIQRFAMALDANTDTSSQFYTFVIPTPLQVPAGGKVISYEHFKSGNPYPLGTSVDDANYFAFSAGDPNGANLYPVQSAGSYMASLISNNQDRYDSGFCVYSNATINELLPTMFFDATTSNFQVPDVYFYLECNSCNALSVPNVTNIVSSSNAYPSPANSALYVPFTLSTTADVTVTLTNTLGQVVRSQDMGNVISGKATFTTSNLAGGIYFYTVNANGQRTTGRVLIAH